MSLVFPRLCNTLAIVVVAALNVCFLAGRAVAQAPNPAEPAGMRLRVNPAPVPGLADEAIAAAVREFQSGRVPDAIRLARPVAERGNHDAEYVMGLFMESLPAATFGNYREAAIWYWRAAQAGLPAAMNNLAALHVDGKGVPVDFRVARLWYQRASDAGNALSQYNLALMYGRGQGVPRDEKSMLGLLQRSADAGFARAQAQLGRLYLEGTGVKADPVLAVDWFRKSATQGDVQGQYFLGLVLKYGTGTARNPDESWLWLKRAAAQGHVLANWELARDYETGDGVSADKVLALRYYELAAAGDHIPSIRRLQEVFRDGELGQIADLSKAAFWERKAGTLGARAAMRDGTMSRPTQP